MWQTGSRMGKHITNNLIDIMRDTKQTKAGKESETMCRISFFSAVYQGSLIILTSLDPRSRAFAIRQTRICLCKT